MQHSINNLKAKIEIQRVIDSRIIITEDFNGVKKLNNNFISTHSHTHAHTHTHTHTYLVETRYFS